MRDPVIQEKINPIPAVDTPDYAFRVVPPSLHDIFQGPSHGSSTTILVFGGENSSLEAGGLSEESPGQASMKGYVSGFTYSCIFTLCYLYTIL